MAPPMSPITRCRVEPMVTHPAPPQTRTCAIHAYGSSGRASATRGYCPVGGVTRLASSESLSCIVPAGMLCPTSPSLPWVAWVSLPHVPWYYTTLRLPPALLGVLRLSLVPRYLACFPRSWCPCRARGQAEAPSHARAFGHPVPHSGPLVKETDGSPKFPSSPCEAMPRSQTPVVSCALATAHPGLLPSGH